MKRTITVRADEVLLKATISATFLTRNELTEVRDELADRLMKACTDLPYRVGADRLHKVRVSS